MQDLLWLCEFFFLLSSVASQNQNLVPCRTLLPSHLMATSAETNHGTILSVEAIDAERCLAAGQLGLLSVNARHVSFQLQLLTGLLED